MKKTDTFNDEGNPDINWLKLERQEKKHTKYSSNKGFRGVWAFQPATIFAKLDRDEARIPLLLLHSTDKTNSIVILSLFDNRKNPGSLKI